MNAINLDAKFMTFDGVDTLIHNEKDFTLREAITESLLGVGAGTPMSGEQKALRFNLARKVKQAGETVELSAGEVKEARHTIGEAYATVVVGQAFEWLPIPPEEGKITPLKLVE
jgi:hypothetical protein